MTKLTSQRLYGFDIWGHACTTVTAGDFKFWHRVGACGSAFTPLTSLRVGTRGRPLREHRRPHACCNNPTGPSRRQPHTPGQTLSVALYLLFLRTCLRCRFRSIPGSKLPWKLLRSCLCLCTCLLCAPPPKLQCKHRGHAAAPAHWPPRAAACVTRTSTARFIGTARRSRCNFSIKLLKCSVANL